MTGDLRSFSPFHLDAKNEQLWRDNGEVRLRRKTFAVLRYLVEHPGELVTKAALLDAVWPDVSVSDSMPAISVRELRKALGDDAENPRFIETVQGRGYRFIAPVTLESAKARAPSTPSPRSLPLHAARNAFVGRDGERIVLSSALADALSGQGRICLISGEPGIGKSRLCAEAAAEAAAKEMQVLIGRCSEQEAVPFLPFVEVLESCIDSAQDPEALRAMLGQEGPELGRMLPKLRRLVPDLSPPLQLAGEQARRHLFDSVCSFIARGSRICATLLILEDLHWADESTLALFNHLSQRYSELPLLIVVTHRTSAVDVNPTLARMLEALVRSRMATQIRLTGLPSADVADMLKGLSGQAPPTDIVGEFYKEIGGNPFFVEELYQYLSEEKRLFDGVGNYHGKLKISEVDVPSNVRLVVGRRLGRIGDGAGKIVATAAVIGRSFTFELLEASTRVEAETLLDCLDEAEAVGLIRSTTEYAEPRLEFSHELIRQAILSQLSVMRCRRLHLEVAVAIERMHPHTLNEHYAELAYHYTQTTDASKAVTYLHLAAVHATQHSAHIEAVNDLISGLELLKKLPETVERDRLELKMQIALAPSLILTKGYTAPEVESAAFRAMVLSERVGEPTERFWAQHGLAIFNMMCARFRKMSEVARKLLITAQETTFPILLQAALQVMGMSLYADGDLRSARSHLEEAIAIYDHEHCGNAITSLTYAAWVLWCLGYSDQARERAERMVAIARESGQTVELAAALNHFAWLSVHLRDTKGARKWAEAGIELSTENEFPFWLVQNRLMRGWALAFSGEEEKGIAQMQQALAARRAMGSMGGDDSFCGWLAGAYLKAGRYAEGLRLVAEHLEFESEGRPHKPELHRLKGELLLMQDPSAGGNAERCIRTAIAIARTQASKIPELRATMSLARLLDKQGKRREARSMLAKIHSWFTEGFDTLDLIEAKALLEVLST
jgi:predicted ATPase/DNA-binding winged helix-turn-helix (wHTH) protein